MKVVFPVLQTYADIKSFSNYFSLEFIIVFKYSIIGLTMFYEFYFRSLTIIFLKHLPKFRVKMSLGKGFSEQSMYILRWDDFNDSPISKLRFLKVQIHMRRLFRSTSKVSGQKSIFSFLSFKATTNDVQHLALRNLLRIMSNYVERSTYRDLQSAQLLARNTIAIKYSRYLDQRRLSQFDSIYFVIRHLFDRSKPT